MCWPQSALKDEPTVGKHSHFITFCSFAFVYANLVFVIFVCPQQQKQCVQNIGKSVVQGLVDSIRGTAVVFYLDREVNKKLQINNSSSQQENEDALTTTTTTTSKSSFKKQDNNKRPE